MRVLGVDLGLRRIGLALSDPSGTLARPWQTLERGDSDRKAATALARVIDTLARDDDGLSLVVVGLPRRLDGADTDQTEHVRQMVEALGRRVKTPIALHDERLSSHEADARLAATDRDWRRRKARLDAAAAAVILQDYLDGHRTSHTPTADDEA